MKLFLVLRQLSVEKLMSTNPICLQSFCLLIYLPLRQQIYPDEGHFLTLQSHQHLYATLTSFYRECLKEELLPLPDEEEEEEE